MSRTIDPTRPLNDIMEFDCVIEVHEDGSITDRDDLWAPDLWDGELESDKWGLFGSYSSQQGGGALMHNCESIGGRMEDDIRETPGVYVAVVCYWSPTEDDDPEDEETIVEGWAVAYLK